MVSAALSAIQSGGEGGRVGLPLVLIAHPDPELDIGRSLDSIISMQQPQDVRVNIKFVAGEVHCSSTDASRTGNTGRKKKKKAT